MHGSTAKRKQLVTPPKRCHKMKEKLGLVNLCREQTNQCTYVIKPGKTCSLIILYVLS